MGVIIAVIVVLLLAIWVVSCQRRLAVMNENINDAMAQIGVQLASSYDVLTALWNLAGGCAVYESQMLIETVRSRRSAVTAASSPRDVLKQEKLISEALERISMVAEQYSELKTNENYAKCMNALDGYRVMIRTSELIYNDNVTKLNRELRTFPTFLLAGILGSVYHKAGETDGYRAFPRHDSHAVQVVYAVGISSAGLSGQSDRFCGGGTDVGRHFYGERPDILL